MTQKEESQALEYLESIAKNLGRLNDKLGRIENTLDRLDSNSTSILKECKQVVSELSNIEYNTTK